MVSKMVLMEQLQLSSTYVRASLGAQCFRPCVTSMLRLVNPDLRQFLLSLLRRIRHNYILVLLTFIYFISLFFVFCYHVGLDGRHFFLPPSVTATVVLFPASGKISLTAFKYQGLSFLCIFNQFHM